MFFLLHTSTIHKGGVFFNIVGNAGLLHKGTYKQMIGLYLFQLNGMAPNQKDTWSKIEEYNKSRGAELDWSLGICLGHRYALPKDFFLDWGYLDFSHGFSFSTLRFGKYLSDRWSIFGTCMPLTIMTDGWIKILTLALKMNEKHTQDRGNNSNKGEMKQVFDDIELGAEHFNYRFPIMIAIGLGLGIGASYRISPRVSFIGQYILQVSYYDLAYIAASVGLHYAKKYNKMSAEESKFLEVAEESHGELTNITHIRHRISIGIEFHRQTY